MKLSITALLLLLPAMLYAAGLQKTEETILDESIHVFRNPPTDMVVVSDSLLYVTDRTHMCYLSNYRTGSIVQAYDLEQVIAVNYLAHRYLHTDTLGESYTKLRKQWEMAGLHDIKVGAIREYDATHILLAMDVTIPVTKIEKDDTVATGGNFPFYIIVEKATFQLKHIDRFDLDSQPEKRLFEAPMFGFDVWGDKVYVAYTAGAAYDGPIFSMFDKNSFSRLDRKVNIFHKPYKNTSGLPLVSSFRTYHYGQEAYVCNGGAVYRLSDEKLLFDAGTASPQVHSIGFFIPLDERNETYYIYYSARHDSVSLPAHKYTARYHRSTHTLTDVKEVPNTMYSPWGNRVVAIEKREENYVYVVYKMD